MADWATSNEDQVPAWLNHLLLEPNDLTQPALDPIAFYGVADTGADGKAKSAVPQIVGQKTERQISIGGGTPLATDRLKALVFSDSISAFHGYAVLLRCSRSRSDKDGGNTLPVIEHTAKASDAQSAAVSIGRFPRQRAISAQSRIDLRVDIDTARLLRPLWRRRLMTLRPPGVRIRLRNPWVFSRFRTFGCQVRFVDILHSYLSIAIRQQGVRYFSPALPCFASAVHRLWANPVAIRSYTPRQMRLAHVAYAGSRDLPVSNGHYTCTVSGMSNSQG